MANMSLNQFYDLIIDTLRGSPDLAGIPIDQCSFNPEILGLPVVETAVWVGFDGINSQIPEGGATKRETYIQQEVWRFVVVLRVFDPNYTSRAIDLYEIIRKTLTGLGTGETANSAGLIMQQVAPGQFADGLWLYQMVWQMDNIFVQENQYLI